eukprot:1430164-Karenia_brevis.AAC.1
MSEALAQAGLMPEGQLAERFCKGIARLDEQEAGQVDDMVQRARAAAAEQWFNLKQGSGDADGG